MKQKKSYYQTLSLPNDYYWAGFWEGLHHFTQKTEKGFLTTSATEEDIENGDMIFMIEMGLTRNCKFNNKIK
jgi:hypothetical protein